MEHYIGGRVDFNFIREIRKEWNPFWENSEVKVNTNDFSMIVDLDKVEMKEKSQVFYHVKSTKDELIETITSGNYITMKTKMENAGETAIQIAKHFGLLYTERLESKKAEEIIDMIMIKNLKHYNYSLMKREVSTENETFDVKMEIEDSVLYVRKKLNHGFIGRREDLFKIEREMEHSNHFIGELKDAIEKQSMRMILGG